MVLEDYDGAAVLVHTVRKVPKIVQFGLVALFLENWKVSQF
jgi:hypothetical protein